VHSTPTIDRPGYPPGPESPETDLPAVPRGDAEKVQHRTPSDLHVWCHVSAAPDPDRWVPDGADRACARLDAELVFLVDELIIDGYGWPTIRRDVVEIVAGRWQPTMAHLIGQYRLLGGRFDTHHDTGRRAQGRLITCAWCGTEVLVRRRHAIACTSTYCKNQVARARRVSDRDHVSLADALAELGAPAAVKPISAATRKRKQNQARRTRLTNNNTPTKKAS
jgi:hypothetical protein